jgi:hypothetical protein
MQRRNITLPEQITAGLDFQTVVCSPAFPATSWTLNAVIRGPQQINLTASADGTDFVISALAATTETWTPGTYWYSLRVTNGTSTQEIGTGQLTVIADLATVTAPYDGRSQFQIALDAIDAVIAKRATVDQQRYKINERELWRTPVAELLTLRAYYATKVRQEIAKANGKSRFGRPIIVKFHS